MLFALIEISKKIATFVTKNCPGVIIDIGVLVQKTVAAFHCYFVFISFFLEFQIKIKPLVLLT